MSNSPGRVSFGSIRWFLLLLYWRKPMVRNRAWAWKRLGMALERLCCLGNCQENYQKYCKISKVYQFFRGLLVSMNTRGVSSFRFRWCQRPLDRVHVLWGSPVSWTRRYFMTFAAAPKCLNRHFTGICSIAWIFNGWDNSISNAKIILAVIAVGLEIRVVSLPCFCSKRVAVSKCWDSSQDRCRMCKDGRNYLPKMDSRLSSFWKIFQALHSEIFKF